MTPEKFIELQNQIRENNEDVANFLSDMNSWRESVNSKSAELQNTSFHAPELPAIRNALLKKKKKSSKKSSPKEIPKSIKSYDYRAWEEFDVDKALTEIDAVNGAAPSDSKSSETDEEWENHRRIGLAKEARELGNLRFKEGQYSDAIEHYTSAVRLTPEDPVPLTNRAFAHLKLERFASAEADCSAALVLDSTNIKALFRRALSRKSLNKISEAVADLEFLLKLEPSNKFAAQELSILTRKSETYTQQTIPDFHSTKIPAFPVNRTRQFRRVPIVEVGRTSAAPSKLPTNVDVPINIPASSKSDNPKSHQDERQTVCSRVSPMITLSPSGPSNWYQLERELREVNSSGSKLHLTDMAVRYLCTIPPSSYSKVIGNNLETDFISQLLQALDQSADITGTDIALRLYQLSRLSRFDVAWMMASDDDRNLATKLVSRLQVNATVPLDKLNSIRERFR